MSSRGSNSHRFGVIAPTSMTWLPDVERWFLIRVSSAKKDPQILRATALRGSSSFSMAST
jgi:hypothetical protein